MYVFSAGIGLRMALSRSLKNKYTGATKVQAFCEFSNVIVRSIIYNF